MTAVALQLGMIAVTVLVYLIIVFNFYHRMFEPVYQSKALAAGVFLLGLVLLTGVNLLENPVLNLTVYTLYIIFVGVLLYGATRGSDILSLFLLILFLISTELVGQLVVSLVYTTPFSISTGNFAGSTITFFSYQLTMLFIERKKRSFRFSGHWITLVAIPGIGLFLFAAILNLLTADSSYGQVILATCACLLVFAVNIIVYFLFGRIAALHQQKEQYAVMEQQKQYQFRYFSELEQKTERSRKLFHDIKNHINTLELMCVGQDEGAKPYAAALRGRIDALALPATGSRVLNVLLNDRRELANANGIDFEVACEDIDLSFISDFDLTTILGNLLDNAFDECLHNQQTQNLIDISVCQINHFIVIVVSNTCAAPPQTHGSRYVSTKKGHSGLGLLNVQETVQAYDGTFTPSYAKGKFTVQLTFPGQKNSFEPT